MVVMNWGVMNWEKGSVVLLTALLITQMESNLFYTIVTETCCLPKDQSTCSSKPGMGRFRRTQCNEEESISKKFLILIFSADDSPFDILSLFIQLRHTGYTCKNLLLLPSWALSHASTINAAF